MAFPPRCRPCCETHHCSAHVLDEECILDDMKTRIKSKVVNQPSCSLNSKLSGRTEIEGWAKSRQACMACLVPMMLQNTWMVIGESGVTISKPTAVLGKEHSVKGGGALLNLRPLQRCALPGLQDLRHTVYIPDRGSLVGTPVSILRGSVKPATFPGEVRRGMPFASLAEGNPVGTPISTLRGSMPPAPFLGECAAARCLHSM